MSIHVHIERLVFDGSPDGPVDHVVESLREELEQLLGERSVSPRLLAHSALPALPRQEYSRGAQELPGRAIAAALHRGLSDD